MSALVWILIFIVDSVLNIRDLMIINALPTNTHSIAVTFTAQVLYGLATYGNAKHFK